MIRFLTSERLRNYWSYSIGCAIAWAIILIVVLMTRGKAVAKLVMLIFFGYWIAWVSGTIARYAYPPPKFWRSK